MASVTQLGVFNLAQIWTLWTSEGPSRGHLDRDQALADAAAVAAQAARRGETLEIFVQDANGALRLADLTGRLDELDAG